MAYEASRWLYKSVPAAAAQATRMAMQIKATSVHHEYRRDSEESTDAFY